MVRRGLRVVAVPGSRVRLLFGISRIPVGRPGLLPAGCGISHILVGQLGERYAAAARGTLNGVLQGDRSGQGQRVQNSPAAASSIISFMVLRTRMAFSLSSGGISRPP